VRIDSQQAETFRDTLMGAAMQICPQYGIDPEDCIKAAAEATCFGKFAIHNNYFNYEGNGDQGHNVYIRSERTGQTANGGMEPRMIRLARFSSPEASIRAWCRRHK
jgi:hypothetical protein